MKEAAAAVAAIAYVYSEAQKVSGQVAPHQGLMLTITTSFLFFSLLSPSPFQLRLTRKEVTIALLDADLGDVTAQAVSKVGESQSIFFLFLVLLHFHVLFFFLFLYLYLFLFLFLFL